MQSVAIKIKKESVRPEGAPLIQPPSPPRPNKKNQPNKLFFWLPAILCLILAAVLAAFSFLKPASPYQDLIPSQAVGVIYFNQGPLAGSAKALAENNYAWPPFVWLKDAWQELLTEHKIEIKQISPFFEEPMALVWLAGSGPRPVWLLLTTKKAGDSAFAAKLEQLEKQLKQNYNLISDVYRQIKIVEIKSLEPSRQSVYYGQAKKYFLVADNLNSLKETIDKIIGR
jgi:hypothetical protein